MTNSRLTDPEVLEFRFPVRLESYEIRAGLGRRRAAGRAAMAACGGCASWSHDGQHPVERPQACAVRHGGRPAGQVGRQPVVRADGRVEALDHIGSAEMQPGDMFEIHTPGGGGFGTPRG